MKSTGLRYRWFTENCHEFVLPSGQVLLVDPIFPPSREGRYGGFYSGCQVDDLQRVDYVFVSHMHGDHVAQLREICEKFNPYILVHQASVITLSKALDLRVRKIIPLTDFQEYDFGTFKFTPYPGTHVATIGDKPLNEAKDTFGRSGNEDMDDAMAFGSCFNTNFWLEVPGGIRVAFIQGMYTDLVKQIFYRKNPTLVIRQLSRIDLFPEIYDQLLECVEDTQTGLFAFMCHHHKEKDPVKTAGQMNADLEEKGVATRVFVPTAGKWIRVCSSIKAEEPV